MAKPRKRRTPQQRVLALPYLEQSKAAGGSETYNCWGSMVTLAATILTPGFGDQAGTWAWV